MTKIIITYDGPKPNPGTQDHIAALLTNKNNKFEIEIEETVDN